MRTTDHERAQRTRLARIGANTIKIRISTQNQYKILFLLKYNVKRVSKILKKS